MTHLFEASLQFLALIVPVTVVALFVALLVKRWTRDPNRALDAFVMTHIPFVLGIGVFFSLKALAGS